MKQIKRRIKRNIKKNVSFGKTPILATVLTLCAFIILAWQMGFFGKKTINVSSRADGVLYVHYIDVGQGDSALITTPSGETALIDAGPRSSENALVAYLQNAGIESIKYLILTHPHEDHIGGAPAVFEKFEVKNVIMSDANAETSIFRETLEAIEKEACETILAVPERSYTLGDAVLSILGPVTTDDVDLNNASVITKLTYQDTDFLFTGDAEASAEDDLISGYTTETLNCDVLKVGHHGSSTSTSDAFLQAVSPTYSVISCEFGNDYGHPHSETLEILERYAVTLHRTDLEGTVIFSSNGVTVNHVTTEE